MRKTLNKIPSDRLRVFLKEHVFKISIAKEMAEKCRNDIIQLRIQQSLEWAKGQTEIMQRIENKIKVKESVILDLEARSQPSILVQRITDITVGVAIGVIVGWILALSLN